MFGAMQRIRRTGPLARMTSDALNTRQLVDGTAIDESTTELMITGRNTDGAPAHGIDDVRIVGGGG